VLEPIAFLIAAAAAVLAFLAAGRTQGIAGRPPGARFKGLGALAGGAALAGLLAGNIPLRPLNLLVFAPALAALLGACTATVASLTVAGAGRRWLRFVAAPFALFSAVTVLAGGPIPGAATLLLPVTLRTPWLDKKVGLGVRAALFFGAIAAIVVGPAVARGLSPLPSGVAAVLKLAALSVFSFAGALIVRLLIQFPGRLFDRFRLRTRLVVSYVLIAAIPVSLIAAFLIIGAYVAMGSYLATLASRLLAPNEAARRALAVAVEDTALVAAFAAEDSTTFNNLDRLAYWHLAGSANLLLAVRRELPDTTRTTWRWAPRAAVPPVLAVMREPLPALPADAMVYAGDQVFSTTAITKQAADHEFSLRAFSPLDSQLAVDAARVIQAEIAILTSDSLSVESSKKGVGVSINIGDEQGSGPPRWVFATQAKQGGTYGGGQLIHGWTVESNGNIRRQDALLIVKFSGLNVIRMLRDTADNPLNSLVLLALGVIGGLFLLVEAASLVTGGTIARNIHRAVAMLHQGTRRLAEDDLDHRIELDRRDELGELAGSFNLMAQGLNERRRLALEREHMVAELLVARSIQRRLLPSRVPDIPGLEVAGTSIPSREVGGDSYDFLPWGDQGDQLLISVADVSGKGIPAALLMSNLQAGLRSQMRRPATLSRVLAELNELVLASTDPGRFITLAIALIDPRNGFVTYANAGHNRPLLRRAGGEIETLAVGGILLGVLPGAVYDETRVEFNPGDAIVLYTDGVVEAATEEGVFFGDERLESLLRDTKGLGAAAICDRIVAEVEQFSEGNTHGDDLTVVVVRRTDEDRG
jgi:serine phosphatase RsbU (regulator of sigma subunit)